MPIHPSFASTAEAAHEKLVRLMQTEDGVELPTADEYKVFPVSSDFVRYFAVRDVSP